MVFTIKDVAAKCGLSVTTVSLVLNNRPNRISEKNKEIILKTAKELNYQPNQLAVSMVTKKTNTIGLILPDIGNLYFAELAKKIEAECSLNGYTVIYGNTSDDVNRDFLYLNTFLNQKVDALLVVHSNYFGIEEQKRFLQTIKNNRIPVLAVDRTFESSQIPTVMIDQRVGGYMATKHLLSLGHRRIGCITGIPSVNSSIERLQGYKMVLEEAGIEFDDRLVYSGDFRPQSGATALPVLLKQGVSAIFACNDMMAMGVYQACIENKIRIPRDLSVIGFDNVFFTEFIDPPLTTIIQPVAEIGRQAAKQVIHMIQGNHLYSENTVLLPKLLIRNSTLPFVNLEENA